VTTPDYGKKITALLKRLRGRFPDASLAPITAPIPPSEASAAVPSRREDPPPAEPADLVDDGAEDVDDREGDELDPPAKVVGTMRNSNTDRTPPTADVRVRELVYSMLLWECSATQAQSALRRIDEGVVDLNELRVCLAEEIASILGAKYPLGPERGARLRAALTDVFRRQHGLRIDNLEEMGKREGSAYLHALEGVPQFVAARVALVHLDAHVIPMDERLLALLRKERAIDPELGVVEAANCLERHIPASETRAAAAVLQAWSDAEGSAPRRESLVRNSASQLEDVVSRSGSGIPAGTKKAPRGSKERGGRGARGGDGAEPGPGETGSRNRVTGQGRSRPSARE
jgi:hypothetical protein